jgi:AraC-like DNA-binding protein
MEHRDVGFYAAELCISPRYLSRVVHSVSGRTVVDYVNRMLIAEAAYLLRQTSLSITQIANRLGFAEVTTFARFFRRMKGMNPREYRKMGD